MAISVLGSPHTFEDPLDDESYSLPTGNNRLLVIWCGIKDAGQDDITGINFDSTAMTQAVESAWSSGDNCKAQIWYMLEADLPAGGSSYTVDFLEALGAVAQCGGAILTFGNVKQQVPEDTDHYTYTNNDNPGRDLTSTQGAMGICAVMVNNGGSDVIESWGTDQVEAFDIITALNTTKFDKS